MQRGEAGKSTRFAHKSAEFSRLFGQNCAAGIA
jgi:hypothetical protein